MAQSGPIRRRRLLAAGLAAGAGAVLPTGLSAALVPTPRQTPGPFYPLRLPLDSDADLVQVEGSGQSAAGVVTHVFGQVLDRSGRPLAAARVEIWQCDAFGHYHHPHDRGGRADPNFQGYGHMLVGADAAFRFRTIKPVPYPGRAPHIHFAISGPGIERLTTQMYVAGEPANARDGILGRVRDAAARARLIVPLEPAPEMEPGALAGRFDIVLDERFVPG
jgi:protocatechuate 3,4-dioxygenase beta subunit